MGVFVLLLVGAFAYVHRKADEEQRAIPPEAAATETPVTVQKRKRVPVATERADAGDAKQVTLPTSQVASAATEMPKQAVQDTAAPPKQGIQDGATPDPSQDSQPLSPTVFVQGTGNIDVRGVVIGGGRWGSGWNSNWGKGWSSGSGSGWDSDWAGSYATQDFHNQTMELAKTFLQRCPQVKVTINRKSADYLVALNHQAFHGIIYKNNQIMVTRRDGQVVISTVARSVGRNVQDACAAIVSDWGEWGAGSHVAPGAEPTEAPVQEPPMRVPSQIERDRCVDDSGNTIC